MRAMHLFPPLLALLSGCASFEHLRADDLAVTEVEVHAAGAAAGEADLTAHLHHILEHRDGYGVGVVVAALVSLGERGDPASVPLIVALARDPDEEVRWHVATALRRLGGPEAEATLRRMADGDESALVRRESGRSGDVHRP